MFYQEMKTCHFFAPGSKLGFAADSFVGSGRFRPYSLASELRNCSLHPPQEQFNAPSTCYSRASDDQLALVPQNATSNL